MFTADGLFVDQAGNLVNGSIFIGQLGKPLSARAVTVFAPDGGHPHVPMDRFGLETLMTMRARSRQHPDSPSSKSPSR